MELSEIMEDTFVLLSAEWNVARALRFLEGQRYTHVVIRRLDRDFWYLFRREIALDKLKRGDPEIPLFDVFELHEYTSTPASDARSEAETAPDQVVVLREGRVVGFYDVSSPPTLTTTRKGVHSTDAKTSFEAYPALSMPVAAAAETEFEIFVGFRDTPDRDVTGGELMRAENIDPSTDCLVVLVGDGVKLDRDHDHIPLRLNAQTRFLGRLASDVKDGIVKALFFVDSQLIGTAKRKIVLEGSPSDVPLNLGPPFSISPPLPESAIDYWVSLTCLRDGTLEWRLAAPAAATDITTRKLTTELSETKQFASDLMRDLKTQDHRGVAARNILETTGQEITALLPPDFFEVLYDLHARLGRIPTLLLLTNEIYVPWELAYLQRRLDATAPPFLAAQVQMGRWLEDSRVMLPPAVALDVKRITAVAAQYGLSSGQRELKEAIAEQQSLCAKWQAVGLNASRPDIDAMVAGTKIPGHLVHFAVHGYGDPTLNNHMLLLADGTKYPASALTGAYAPGDTPRFAFVFLNACQVGAPGRTLGHAGGFPGTLIIAGTLGFIAPLWEVDDDCAHSFAESFYSDVFGRNQPIGSALRLQRCTYDSASTTPMAYIYYGHPALRLQFIQSKGDSHGNAHNA